MATVPVTEEKGFKHDLHRLGEGVDALKADGRALAQGTADAARSGVAEIQQGAKHAVDVAKDKFDDAKHAAGDAADSLKDVIARHPMSSIGIAAGVGLLIGMAMCRPRS